MTDRKSLLLGVLPFALIAGTLDLIAPTIIQYTTTGKFPTKMLHYIAGGALGLERSMAGGIGVGALGLFFHYFIAFSFTLFFFLVYPRWNLLGKNIFLSAVLCGCFAWAVMSFIVLPLSALPSRPFTFTLASLIGPAVLTVAIGLPAAYGASHFYREGQS